MIISTTQVYAKLLLRAGSTTVCSKSSTQLHLTLHERESAVTPHFRESKPPDSLILFFTLSTKLIGVEDLSPNCYLNYSSSQREGPLCSSTPGPRLPQCQGSLTSSTPRQEDSSEVPLKVPDPLPCFVVQYNCVELLPS